MYRLLDELLAVYVVFRTPLLEDAVLEPYLARLVVHIEAFAFSTAPPPDQDPKAGPPKELIYSGTINHSDKPIVVSHGEGNQAYTYVIWKVIIFIGEKFEPSDRARNLTFSSSSSREISQACGILPAYGIFQTSRETQERHHGRRLPAKSGAYCIESTSVLRDRPRSSGYPSTTLGNEDQ
jgi:hypothetical protein